MNGDLIASPDGLDLIVGLGCDDLDLSPLGMDLSFDLGLGFSPSDVTLQTIGSLSPPLIIETQQQQPQQDIETKPKGHKFNGKAVQCYDLEGNLLRTFQSCSDASKAMKATPVEISQCCKGTKDNIRGIRYRFLNDNQPKKVSLPKRGYVIETVSTDSLIQGNDAELLGPRTSRTSRGIVEQVKTIDSISSRKRSQLLDPPTALPRKWSKVTVKIGHMFLQKWVPNSSSLNPILNPNKTTDTKTKSKRKR